MKTHIAVFLLLALSAVALASGDPTSLQDRAKLKLIDTVLHQHSGHKAQENVRATVSYYMKEASKHCKMASENKPPKTTSAPTKEKSLTDDHIAAKQKRARKMAHAKQDKLDRKASEAAKHKSKVEEALAKAKKRLQEATAEVNTVVLKKSGKSSAAPVSKRAHNDDLLAALQEQFSAQKDLAEAQKVHDAALADEAVRRCTADAASALIDARKVQAQKFDVDRRVLLAVEDANDATAAAARAFTERAMVEGARTEAELAVRAAQAPISDLTKGAKAASEEAARIKKDCDAQTKLTKFEQVKVQEHIAKLSAAENKLITQLDAVDAMANAKDQVQVHQEMQEEQNMAAQAALAAREELKKVIAAAADEIAVAAAKKTLAAAEQELEKANSALKKSHIAVDTQVKTAKSKATQEEQVRQQFEKMRLASLTKLSEAKQAGTNCMAKSAAASFKVLAAHAHEAQARANYSQKRAIAAAVVQAVKAGQEKAVSTHKDAKHARAIEATRKKEARVVAAKAAAAIRQAVDSHQQCQELKKQYDVSSVSYATAPPVRVFPVVSSVGELQANLAAKRAAAQAQGLVRVDKAVVVKGNLARYSHFAESVSMRQGFEFEVQVQGTNDVHIALMTSETERSADAWEVVVGGWANTRSVIRMGTQGRELASVADANSVGPKTKFRSIWLSYDGDDKILSVFNDVYENPIMAIKMPALSADKLHVALGAWDSDITYKVPFYAPQSRFNEAMELASNKEQPVDANLLELEMMGFL